MRQSSFMLQLCLYGLTAAIQLATAAPATTTAPPPKTAIVEQPRAFGHTVGDLLQQRVKLGTVSAPFLPAELPRIGRIGASLWRRRSELQIDPSGQHWLLVEYQLINTPQALSVWYLPRLTLKATTGSATLAVANTPFSVGPFTPPQPFEETALPALQPDDAPSPVDVAPLEQRIRFAAIGLLAVLSLWAAITGWRHFYRGRHLPFSRALRELRALDGTDALAVQRRLHRAFNDSAGQVVRPASLPVLLRRAPYLAVEREAIEQFLQESQAIFFGGRTAPDPAAATALARRLQRLERRHAP